MDWRCEEGVRKEDDSAVIAVWCCLLRMEEGGIGNALRLAGDSGGLEGAEMGGVCIVYLTDLGLKGFKIKLQDRNRCRLSREM